MIKKDLWKIIKKEHKSKNWFLIKKNLTSSCFKRLKNVKSLLAYPGQIKWLIKMKIYKNENKQIENIGVFMK